MVSIELFKLLGKIAIENQSANEAIDETTDKAENASESMSDSFKKIGGAVVAYLSVDKIIDFGASITNAAAEVSAEASAFEQIMGDYSDEASEKVGKIADATGMVEGRITPYMTSMTAKFKGLGYDVTDATDLASRGLNLAADASAFWDKSLDDSMSALNSFINGSYEGGEAIGVFANDTQLASYAVKSGLIDDAKEWANLEESIKQATRLEYAEDMMKASGATGQAAKEADQYANVQANLTEKWRQFKAQIGEPLLQNVVLPAMTKLSGLVDKLSTGFQTASKWCKENQTALQLIAIAAATLTTAIIAYNIAQNAAAIATAVTTTATTAFGAVMAFVTSPITLVVAAIGALIAIGVLLYKNWDEIKAKALEIWGAIKDFFVNLWNNIKETASNIWTAIKDFFVNTWTSAKESFTKIWNTITSFLSDAWETIKNVVQVGVMFIGSILEAAFKIITLPFQFIWENCKKYIIAAWEAIKNAVSTAINAVKNTITTVFNAIKSFFAEVWDAIKNTVETVLNAIKNVISVYWNIVSSIFTTVWNAIKNFYIGIWNNIVAFLSPIVNTIKNVISTAWEKIKSVTETVFNAIKSFFTEIWEAIKNAVKTAIDTIKNTITTIWNSIKSVTSSIWNGIKSSISGVVNGISSTVSGVFNGIKNTATSVWNNIKTAITSPIEKAKDTIKSALDKVKGFFGGLKLEFPKIKLPHFSIKGEFSLKPPSVPHLGIDWYAKAMDDPMVMDNPTIFGYNPATGNFMGGGEAGSEVVSGTNTLMNMISQAVSGQMSGMVYYLQQLISILADYFPQILENMGHDIVADDGTILAKYAPMFDREFGKINEKKKRGR